MDFIKRKYSIGEEIFNSISHGAGALLAIAGCVVLIVFSAMYSGTTAVVSSAVYGGTLILLYLMSTLYHAIQNTKAKKVFQVFDHNTIFLLIAGTYTPYTLVFLKGALGWTLFGIIWGMAILGIVLTSINMEKFKKFSMVCYIGMGWAIIFAIKPLILAIPMISTVFLLLGGVFYSVGVIFYKQHETRYMHSIWHLFVIAGSVFHFFSIFLALINS